MKSILAVLLLASSVSYAETPFMMCSVPYALCAASSTKATGKSIVVEGTTFKEGVAVCPVLTGNSVANTKLISGYCDLGKGKVWSLFSAAKEYPQAPTWAVAPATVRTFITSLGAGNGMSNMWSFPCVVRKEKVNGATLADCYGPINESPINAARVPAGTRVITSAPVGASDPVGGNLP